MDIIKVEQTYMVVIQGMNIAQPVLTFKYLSKESIKDVSDTLGEEFTVCVASGAPYCFEQRKAVLMQEPSVQYHTLWPVPGMYLIVMTEDDFKEQQNAMRANQMRQQGMVQ